MIEGVQKTCVVCGVAFVDLTRAKNKMSCSQECGTAYRRKYQAAQKRDRRKQGVPSLCSHCGTEFAKNRDRTKYCSLKCSIAYSHLRGQAQPIPWGECSECRRAFIKSRSDKGVCSYECAKARMRRRDLAHRVPRPSELQCPRCERWFPVKTHRGGKTYCDPCVAIAVREAAKGSRRRRLAAMKGLPVEKFSSREIYERDGWTCGICGEAIPQDAQWPHRLSPSVDHIIPISKGGAHTRANVQATHLTCNCSKYDKSPELMLSRAGS